MKLSKTLRSILFLIVAICIACLCLVSCVGARYYEYTGATMASSEGTTKSLKVKAEEGQVFILVSPAVTIRTEKDGTASKFVGWQIKGEDTVYPVGEQLTMGNKNLTLIAVWKNAYTVTFVNNDSLATGDLPSLEETYYAVGETIKLPECKMQKQGFGFGGWKSNDGEIYPANSTFTIPNQNVTFTTTWTNVYTLTFDHGATDDQQVTGTAPTLAPREMGATVYLPKCTYSYAGYDFVCWQKDGQNYYVGDTYQVTGNATFVAIWQKSTTASDENFEFVSLSDGTYAIKKASSAQTLPTNLVLPSSFQNISVTQIAENAFKNASIETVTIPATVTIINANAFANCTKLYSVILEENTQLSSIEPNAFASCIRLATFGYTSTSVSVLNMPSTVTKVGDKAFYDCNFKEIQLSSSLNALGHGVFASNNEVTLFTSNNSQFKGGNFITNADETVVYAFAYSSSLAKSVTIDKATEILPYAFADANKLESVTFGTQLASIGKHAFANCYSLTQINQNEENSLATVAENAFLACASLKVFYFGQNLVNLDLTAFEGCSSLKAFEVSTDNPSFTVYGDNLYNKDKTAFLLYATANEDSICSLPETITTICANAFAYGNVEQVLFQGSKNQLISIGEKAFYHCPLLRTLTFWDQITSIGNRAFEYCYVIDNAVLGNNLAELGEYAFYYCSKLSTLSVSNNCPLKAISKNAFANCAITSFDANERIQVIEENAFGACSSLTSVDLSGVIAIKFGAFASCENLRDVTIPATLTTLEGGAFKNCTSNLTFSTEEASSYFSTDEEGNLYNKDKTTLVVCAPKNAITNYVLPSFVTAIGDYAFYNYPITSFDAKNSQLVTIGKYAFADCSTLATVTVPTSLKTISESAFERCLFLTDFVFADASGNMTQQSLEKIERNAFKNCVRLNFYMLGNNIPIIDENAFYLEPEAQSSSYKPEIFVSPDMATEIKSRYPQIASLIVAYND